jgi:uncharacterized protein (DUF427 family)
MKKKTNSEKASCESVWDYPRPPKVEDVLLQIKVIFDGEIIADSLNAKRVLETGHPPVYYLPLQDINTGFLRPSARRTWCEWKGEAMYYDVITANQISQNAAWFYQNPTQEFAEITNYVAFYAGKMEACFVGGERVKPQPGGFYGGWITANIAGPFKNSQINR